VIFIYLFIFIHCLRQEISTTAARQDFV